VGDPLVAVVVLVAAVRHSAAAHMDRGVLPHHTGEDAHQADAAKEGVDRRTDHFPEQRAVGVAAELAGWLPVEVRRCGDAAPRRRR
jgi:hypothetical protein